MNRDELIAAIRSLPDELERLMEALSDDQLRRRPSPSEWSILEVSCHLRDSLEIEEVRIQRLAREDDPVLEPYDQEALAIERNYQGEDVQRVCRALRAYSSGVAHTLQQLLDEDWQRGGLHPELGRVTIDARAQRIPPHAREHSEQMRAIRERIG